ncbi:hypothetical protein [Streptomyces sp. NPDC057838]|uniref:hypothetical protein n=1 Tax=unclassified Streptomyces TaxID=2593676 RepID=UPI00367B405A
MTTPAEKYGYERALNADRQLRALADLATAVCEFIRPADTMCGGCAWDTLVKPLATPLIGWERGYPPESAPDPETQGGWKIVSGSDWLAVIEAAEKDRTPAATETEKWLRTSEAWDAYCGELIRRLNAADPANGHGVHRHRRTRRGDAP